MTTTTPNMNLVLPDVSVTAGPQWATLLNTAYGLIDSHDHSSGKGVTITPSGLNISSDLTFVQNNATNLRTVRLFNNSSIAIGGSDRTCLYSLNNELHYVDGTGTDIQITLSGALNLSGTISALTINDTGFTVQNFGDNTKKFKFSAASIPTSTTRTFTIPDSGANDTFVTQGATQTLTSKTLTNPVIAALNTGSYAVTLPTADGGNGQVIQTNGSGVWSFVTAATTVGNVAANDSNVTFTSASNRVQISNPTATRTYTLPTTGIVAGDQWTFYNQATSQNNYITIQSSGANQVVVLPPNGIVRLAAAVSTPTTAANWIVLERQSQWTAFTHTLTGFGTVTNNNGFYKVNGDSVFVKCSASVGTTSGATAATITIPPGLPVSAAKLSLNNSTGASGNIIGVYADSPGGSSGHMIAAPATSTTTVYLGPIFSNGAATNVPTTAGSVATASNGIFSIHYEYPIA